MKDYPSYMKTWHSAALGDPGGIDITNSAAMNEVLDGVSPYSSLSLIDGGEVLFGNGKDISDFSPSVSTFSSLSQIDLTSIILQYRNNSQVSSLLFNPISLVGGVTNANSSLVQSDFNQIKINQFHSAMRDINAVMSSGFIVGEAVIWSQKSRVLSEAMGDSELRLKGIQDLVQGTVEDSQLQLRSSVLNFELQKDITNITQQFTQFYGVMRVTLDNNNLELIAKDKLWRVKVFQYGGNFLGSLHGSAVSVETGADPHSSLNIAEDTVTGLTWGARIGSFFGPWGTVIGGAIGAIAGGLYGAFG